MKTQNYKIPDSLKDSLQNLIETDGIFDNSDQKLLYFSSENIIPLLDQKTSSYKIKVEIQTFRQRQKDYLYVNLLFTTGEHVTFETSLPHKEVRLLEDKDDLQEFRNVKVDGCIYGKYREEVIKQSYKIFLKYTAEISDRCQQILDAFKEQQQGWLNAFLENLNLKNKE